MITNVQLLRKELDDIRDRVSRLEAFVSIPEPEKQHSRKPDYISFPKPKDGLRRWTNGPGQMDSFTSKRWRDR
jgi:hypothetical protein